MNLTSVLSTSLIALASGIWCAGQSASATPATPFQPSWQSVRDNRTPKWLPDGKFGIDTHWGVYAVPAMGPNATWYSNAVSMRPDSQERAFHGLSIETPKTRPCAYAYVFKIVRKNIFKRQTP